VDLASEKLDTDTIKKHANIYANITTAFSAKQACGEQKSKVKASVGAALRKLVSVFQFCSDTKPKC
jgi:hypothetical protein